MCFDGVKRLCHIRGKLRKKVWINQSDIILVGLRDYQDAKADVIRNIPRTRQGILSHMESSPSPSRLATQLTLLVAIWMKTSSSMTLTATNPDLVVRILMISTIYEHLWILGFLMFCLCCIVMLYYHGEGFQF